MKKITIALFLLISSVSMAQDSVSVLFIGNSYTYANNMSALVQDLAASKGDIVFKDTRAVGGATLGTHANDAQTYTFINSQPWDYVVLQAQSQEPSFPDAQVDTQTLPYALQLADSVYANKFCSEVLFFMTWGRENGDPQWEPISTFDGMNERLRNAYVRFADSVQGSVSPVGVAWKYVRDHHPTIGLYSSDGSHPSMEGSYLTACTFYASLFRKSPVGATFISSLDAVTAGILQSAAEIAVLDSLDIWNLRPLSEHTQADVDFTVADGTVTFDNNSTKALSYEWSFGDMSTSTEVHPVHSYTSTGSYTVQLIAESPCDSDTMEIQIDINTIGISELNQDYTLTTMAPGWYKVHSEYLMEAVLTDASGKVYGHYPEGQKSLEIDLRSAPKGIYFLSVITPSGIALIKWVTF